MKPLLIIALCSGIGACATPTDAPLSPTFGEALASMDRQIIPVAVSDLPPEDSGARATLAIQRGDKGEPKQPTLQGTSNMKITLVPAEK
jgi:hypothetical protein